MNAWRGSSVAEPFARAPCKRDQPGTIPGDADAQLFFPPSRVESPARILGTIPPWMACLSFAKEGIGVFIVHMIGPSATTQSSSRTTFCVAWEMAMRSCSTSPPRWKGPSYETPPQQGRAVLGEVSQSRESHGYKMLQDGEKNCLWFCSQQRTPFALPPSRARFYPAIGVLARHGKVQHTSA